MRDGGSPPSPSGSASPGPTAPAACSSGSGPAARRGGARHPGQRSGREVTDQARVPFRESRTSTSQSCRRSGPEHRGVGVVGQQQSSTRGPPARELPVAPGPSTGLRGGEAGGSGCCTCPRASPRRLAARPEGGGVARVVVRSESRRRRRPAQAGDVVVGAHDDTRRFTLPTRLATSTSVTPAAAEARYLTNGLPGAARSSRRSPRRVRGRAATGPRQPSSVGSSTATTGQVACTPTSCAGAGGLPSARTPPVQPSVRRSAARLPDEVSSGSAKKKASTVNRIASRDPVLLKSRPRLLVQVRCSSKWSRMAHRLSSGGPDGKTRFAAAPEWDRGLARTH